jgi:hypothetical protein
MARHLILARLLKAAGVAAAAALAGLSVHFAYACLVDPLMSGGFAAPASSEPPIALDVLTAKPDAAFQATVLASKPLFMPSRAPPAAIAPPPPPAVVSRPEPPPPPPPAYLVSGIVISAGIRRVLLRTDPASGQWLSQGEVTKEGWTVAVVEPDTVILRHGKRELALSPPGRSSARSEQVARR